MVCMMVNELESGARGALWYDFHRHLPVAESARRGAVLSFSLYEQDLVPDHGCYTMALHPWETERLDAVKLVENELPKHMAEERCLALGECGLDRLRGAPMAVQIELFAHQLAIAKAAKKPLVVHCVRAWGELAAQVRRSGFEASKAIHGFRGSLSVLKQLLAHDWYISVGPDLHGRLPEVTAQIPNSRLLLETDATRIDIKDAYAALAALKGIPINEAQGLIERNIMTFFGFPRKSLSTF